MIDSKRSAGKPKQPMKPPRKPGKPPRKPYGTYMTRHLSALLTSPWQGLWTRYGFFRNFR